jgi:hypothetical protein
MRDQTKPVVVENGYIKVSLNSYLISDYTKFEVLSIDEKKTLTIGFQKFISGSVLAKVYVPLFVWAIAMFIWPQLRLSKRSDYIDNPLVIFSAAVLLMFTEYLLNPENSKDQNYRIYYLCASNKSGKFYIYSSSDKSEIEKYVQEIHLYMSSRSSVSS